MGNGLLIFIVVLEAIVIVWLASKLKQYQKFDQVFRSRANNSGTAESSATGTQGSNRSIAAPPPNRSDEMDDELLDMPGVEPEMNIEEAKLVQLVMARCHYAEFYLEQLDDEYERSQFKHIVDSCMQSATGIADPFFKASALQPLILLLDRAGWETKRDKLLEEVEDEIIRQRILRELAAANETA